MNKTCLIVVLVIALGALILSIGGMVWLGRVSRQTSDNRVRIEELSSKIDDLSKELKDLTDSVNSLKDQVYEIEDRLPKKK